MGELFMFYGDECVHCHEMFPLVDKLEKEFGIKVKRLEVWHSSKNRESYDKANNKIKCTGVPYFYNESTKEGICGAVPYAALKKWALGKK